MSGIFWQILGQTGAWASQCPNGHIQTLM